MADYYDLVLSLIPLTLAGVTVILSLVGVGLTLAVPIGAACSLPLLGHALFVNAPVPAVDGPSPDEDAHARSGPSPAAD
jgi:hypothetical protein